MARTQKAELMANLPAPWPGTLAPRIRDDLAASRRRIVVLDDDPTGTQTVRDVPVLTTWDIGTLAAEFGRGTPCFYLLTNTRAFPVEEAVRIHREIGRNLVLAAGRANQTAAVDFVVVSRSDSTLRGHFPAEVDVLGAALNPSRVPGPDGGRGHLPPVLLVPYFEAGGRYTIGDIHYVADGDVLVPASETPFARDAVFGYRHSDLRAWVEEKTGGSVRATDVASISLDELREGGPEVVRDRLTRLPDGSVCIANSACPGDLEVLAWATARAEDRGRRFLYRTAAGFVAARLGIAPGTLWEPSGSFGATGGLTVVGSHMPTTNAQLSALLAWEGVAPVEVSVAGILASDSRDAVVSEVVGRIEPLLEAGRDVVVFTSRDVVVGGTPAENLLLGSRVSSALVGIVRGVKVRPRYLVAKGGITSSDLATRGLGVRRALVLGQILPGIPVWRLGPETRFPDLTYVVFPGNVGAPDALVEVLSKLRK